MTEIITTQQAECKDCYRCLRGCPVKSIGFVTKQAKIQEERCILCGKCVVECPQKAKVYLNETDEIRRLLQGEDPVILSIAPSFLGSFEESPGQLFNRICQAGFADVEETAIGAALTTREYRRLLASDQWQDKTGLSTCCPVIVNLVERYHPSLMANLLPALSPMVSHARLIKSQRGENCKVVFAGPCIAKLEEARRFGLDGALTFGQLKMLLLEMEALPEKQAPGHYKYEENWLPTRSYPIHNGVLFSVKGAWGSNQDYWSIEGIDQCQEILKAMENGDIAPRFIEMMACQGGCVGGPAIDSRHNLYWRKQRVQDMIKTSESKHLADIPALSGSMAKSFTERPVKEGPFTEAQIMEVLRKMGKEGEKDLRNCEGCGYPSCRDKAVAVLAGLATLDMCIPFMRSKAESLAHMVMTHTPNAVLVLDHQFVLRDFNPAAAQILSQVPLAAGLYLGDYVDVKPYRQALQGKESSYRMLVEYPQWSKSTRQTIVPILAEGLIMLILEDITDIERERLELDAMKENVMDKAKTVIEQQMRVAQEIAGLLGETTAETKATLYELLKHLEDRGNGNIL